jgi:hypothetical protein
MSEFIFAPFLPAHRTTDPNEALDIVKDLAVQPVEVRLGDLVVGEDGALALCNAKTAQKDLYVPTRYAMQSFCSILGIPKPFARQIPLDLLLTNIHRLQNASADQNVCLLVRPGTDQVANIVKAPYTEISYIDFLTAFIAKTNIKHIDITEELVKISLNFDEKRISFGEEGEGLLVQTAIYNSILRSVPLQMSSGLYRTLCENSFVMPFLGKVKANYLLEEGPRLLRFADNVEVHDGEVLQHIFNFASSIPARPLHINEWSMLWKRVKTLVGDADADNIMETDEATRKDTLTKALDWQNEKKNARLKGTLAPDPIVTPDFVYTIANNITAFAHSEAVAGMTQMRLERLGGLCLEKFILN